MKHRFIIIFLLIIFFISCNDSTNDEAKKIWKNEIMQTELSFSKMAQNAGVKTAFLSYAAEDGVLMRNDSVIHGIKAIRNYMKNSNSKGLSWKPDFVDVSNSGDLGYTYGEYTYTYQDSVGNNKVTKGIFHTVWKRQPDNSWKFVWD